MCENLRCRLSIINFYNVVCGDGINDLIDVGGGCMKIKFLIEFIII